MARGGLYNAGKYQLGRLSGEWVAVWRDDGGIRRRYRLHPADESEGTARQALERFARGEDLKRAKDGATDVAAIWQAYIDDQRLEGKRAVPIMEFNWKALAPRFGHLAPAMIDKRACI